MRWSDAAAMTPRGLVLLGGPGSGKDTITAAVGAADPRMSLVGKLKVGTGRTDTYRMVTRGELGSPCAQGWLTGRFEHGSVYAIDVRDVLSCVRQGLLSVTHADTSVRSRLSAATAEYVGTWCCSVATGRSRWSVARCAATPTWPTVRGRTTIWHLACAGSRCRGSPLARNGIDNGFIAAD